MSDETTPEPVATTEPTSDTGTPAPQAGTAGDPGARKPDAAKPKGLSADDHYSRGRKRTEELFAQRLHADFGVQSLDELRDKLAMREREPDDEPDGAKPTVPDVRALRRDMRKLAEEREALARNHERAQRELVAGRERVKRESLRAALASAGALYPDDEVHVLSARVGLSSDWEPEEIDDKGNPTGRSLSDLVAARREQRPDFYRGESREGAGSRPARTVPANGSSAQPEKGSREWRIQQLRKAGHT